MLPPFLFSSAVKIQLLWAHIYHRFHSIKQHEEKNAKQKAADAVPEGAVPTYLLDREGEQRAKILSNMVKQKRKEKAGKWNVPLPKVRGIAEDEMFKVMKTGKNKTKSWKRLVTKATFVGDGFTRKPPKYERFVRPMGLRFKKAHVTHPELKATFQLPIISVKKNPQNPLYTQLGVITKGTVLEVNGKFSIKQTGCVWTCLCRDINNKSLCSFRTWSCYYRRQSCLGQIRTGHQQSREWWLYQRCSSGIDVLFFFHICQSPQFNSSRNSFYFFLISLTHLFSHCCVHSIVTHQKNTSFFHSFTHCTHGLGDQGAGGRRRMRRRKIQLNDTTINCRKRLCVFDRSYGCQLDP